MNSNGGIFAIWACICILLILVIVLFLLVTVFASDASSACCNIEDDIMTLEAKTIKISGDIIVDGMSTFNKDVNAYGKGIFTELKSDNATISNKLNVDGTAYLKNLSVLRSGTLNNLTVNNTIKSDYPTIEMRYGSGTNEHVLIGQNDGNLVVKKVTPEGNFQATPIWQSGI